ncbi:MAG: phosphoribosylanthranilate isomerase [Kiritimatiellae bacterium]|nr:phosphoribosylanthranilate isomerase [Kiritimatiellia bacterium]
MKNVIEVKICGLTSRDDALAALEYGADYLGFVLYDASVRSITPGKMAGILDRIDVPYRAVGVFVNSVRADVEKIASDCNLHAVQLHGDEMACDFVEMPVQVWRSVCMDGGARDAAGEWNAARYVVDAAVRGMYGGTGVTADWGMAAEFAVKHPVILAGGLNPDNIADGIKNVRPLGVDSASGVESVPGKKDLKKVQEFIKRARQSAET